MLKKRIFRAASPAVHVQFHGGESFPLVLAHIDGQILSAEDAIDIVRDVGLPGESAADEGRDVVAKRGP